MKMHRTFILSLIATMTLNMGCKKKGGTINHRITYTTDKNAFRRILGPNDTFHGEFGNYITSITPYKVLAKMNIMMYQDTFSSESHMISYINGHDNDPRFEIALYADFSGNSEIQPEPILYSTDMWKGIFEQKKVTFTYFIFVPYHINLEFVIPPNYGSSKINMLNTSFDTANSRWIAKNSEFNLIYHMFKNYPRLPAGYVFGNTDSTWIYNKEGIPLPESFERPFGGPGYQQPVIKSNKFTPCTVTMPDGGESVEMVSTIVYDTEAIIQVYAGNDNKPYTADDIFTYAPYYWERIKVKLESR